MQASRHSRYWFRRCGVKLVSGLAPKVCSTCTYVPYKTKIENVELADLVSGEVLHGASTSYIGTKNVLATGVQADKRKLKNPACTLYIYRLSSFSGVCEIPCLCLPSLSSTRGALVSNLSWISFQSATKNCHCTRRVECTQNRVGGVHYFEGAVIGSAGRRRPFPRQTKTNATFRPTLRPTI